MSNLTLTPGQIVKVRSRQYLVENVTFIPKQQTRVSLSCVEDDALGEQLEVLWELEIDRQIIANSSWETIASRGFDQANLFSAYLHTLRWNCVTSTNTKLFQSPYRAGIEVKAYQLEPLRKALLMPRIALFIADDVGLGKTIEAGLILREMLMRQRVKRVVISCPPSVVRQWQEEMESRFGLTFIVFDRDFVANRRQERGYGINPWKTHTRFIISHALLRDETYAAPLRDWLGEFADTSMFILDEAHNAAPATSSRYAIDSQLTRTVRDIAKRFEHKLFLSATPHNGHSNSFAALLEILDPQRFCRGVPIKDSKLLDAVMVRRLKQDLREIGEVFPRREVIPIVIDNLPATAPELQLSELLQEYRHLREERLKDVAKNIQNSAILVTTSLQKRLLSSMEAFARTLKVHSKGVQAVRNQDDIGRGLAMLNPLNFDHSQQSLLLEVTGADDERAELLEEEVQAEEDAQMTAATKQSQSQPTARELELLQQMAEIADKHRYVADPRISQLVQWIKANLCPDLGKPDAVWLDKRVIIFTEYTDTKGYLVKQLDAAISHSHQADQRIDVFHGGMGEERREAIKQAFNSDPARNPLRILIATDAAREGVNLQNYCADLFHFDVPWNPSRMEQRNGRVDRKLQRSPIVRCYYFILPQRTEDKVLDVLVKKTATIQQELGSLAPVVEKNISRLLAQGIRHQNSRSITEQINNADKINTLNVDHELINEELEIARKRQKDLSKQIKELEDTLKKSQEWLGLSDSHFRDAISASLQILGESGLTPLDPIEASRDPITAKWIVPALDQRTGADPTWVKTLDSLRVPKQRGQKPWEWRKEAPIRPVIFRDPGCLNEDVVHLHLEHRLVQRLLGRFLAQGFLHDELTRACVCLTEDPIPKAIALGRLSMYGDKASRLHDEIIAVTADWIEPVNRGKKKLQPLKEGEKKDVLALLENSLTLPHLHQVRREVQELLKQNTAKDIEDLIPHLQKQADVLVERAKKKLTARGKQEAVEMRQILAEQKQRILNEQGIKAIQLELLDEKRQLEADRRYWEQRLQSLEQELINEPTRIENSYEVKAVRVEPVGIVYLWPVSR